MTTTETAVQQPSQGHEDGHGRLREDRDGRGGATPPPHRVGHPERLRGILADPERLNAVAERLGV